MKEPNRSKSVIFSLRMSVCAVCVCCERCRALVVDEMCSLVWASLAPTLHMRRE